MTVAPRLYYYERLRRESNRAYLGACTTRPASKYRRRRAICEGDVPYIRICSRYEHRKVQSLWDSSWRRSRWTLRTTCSEALFHLFSRRCDDEEFGTQNSHLFVGIGKTTLLTKVIYCKICMYENSGMHKFNRILNEIFNFYIRGSNKVFWQHRTLHYFHFFIYVRTQEFLSLSYPTKFYVTFPRQTKKSRENLARIFVEKSRKRTEMYTKRLIVGRERREWQAVSFSSRVEMKLIAGHPTNLSLNEDESLSLSLPSSFIFFGLSFRFSLPILFFFLNVVFGYIVDTRDCCGERRRQDSV